MLLNLKVTTDKLHDVLRCLFYIQECRNNQLASVLYEDKFNHLWGELDWLEELQRLLYET